MSVTSIANQVSEAYKESGILEIPEGMKAVVRSGRISRSPEEGRRMLFFVFEDGSELAVDTKGLDLFMSPSLPNLAVYSL